ncbi:pyridoxamine 5'-phosphate oxidase [Ophiocordyceps camponoti-floridani]|uniref:pyridoxal 5'-phosphate synthase n=1 Tax=Ophiocordyceps camponoti-floridani TaxID=2030778 RepID=A0A8H4Q5W7_9HYPO|nr:pyridoxamine 5'-phosphate oxidase [Ophiocordyceps camponoti-floridani]
MRTTLTAPPSLLSLSARLSSRRAPPTVSVRMAGSRSGEATERANLISLPPQAEQFTRSTLTRQSLLPSPTDQFRRWFADASAAVPHAETCVLATAGLPEGNVSARVVYLKEVDAEGGFILYSNWETSRKAADVATNPRVALVFHWEALQRQVRIEGVATRVSPSRSQAYFDTRVRGSRVGAWASRQSSVLVPEGRGRWEDRAREGGWGRGEEV